MINFYLKIIIATCNAPSHYSKVPPQIIFKNISPINDQMNFLNDQISTWQVMMVAKVLGPKDLDTYERFVIEECEYNDRLNGYWGYPFWGRHVISIVCISFTMFWNYTCCGKFHASFQDSMFLTFKIWKLNNNYPNQIPIQNIIKWRHT